jgi:hypothetical protein
MARKGRISKIRVLTYLRWFAESEVEAIDRFRAHVHDAAAAERRSIERRANNLPSEIQEFLADDLHELDAISDLADQLSIVALYSVVEINTGQVLAQRFGPAARKNASYIKRLHKFLMQQQRIDIKRIPHYRAVNELRLLNNAVKHAGRVTAELAREYPRWKQGRKLTGVGAAYERLRRPVPSYILLNVLNWGSNNASL